MPKILNFEGWISLNEQKVSTTFACNNAWYKGEELNTENFGNIISCFAGSGQSLFEFWKNAPQTEKDFILNTLKEGKKDLSKFGITTRKTSDIKKSQMPNVYVINGGFYTERKRGETADTSGFYLDDASNIYIKKEYGDIQQGAHNIVELINKVNSINKASYINGEKQVEITDIHLNPKLATQKGTYKGYEYSIVPNSLYEGLIYYPALPSPFKKVMRTEMHKEKIPFSPFESRMPNNFADNEVEPTPEFLQKVKDYFNNIINNKGTITDLKITSGASNARTSYQGLNDNGKPILGTEKTWENNKKLSIDRGNRLYKILKADKKIGDKIPELKTPVIDDVQPCTKKGANGECLETDESKKYLKIEVFGYTEKDIPVEFTTNQIAYQIMKIWITQL